MPFISENELERALVSAVKNPASAPDFYRLLLESELLVMGTVEGQEDAAEQFAVAPGGKVNLVTGFKNGSTFLPVFSSLLRMQEYVKQETKYLRVNGRALLDLTRGAPVTLNPASEYGKEHTPQEVAQLLDPQVPRGQPRTIIGEADYPMPLVETLTDVFAARADIEAAWMIQVTFADRDEPHPLVGVEFDSGMGSDWPSLMQAVEAAADRSVPGMVFDLQRIDRSHPNSLTAALLQVPPFYQRRKAAPAIH
ncbi:MAG TPA: enhanced serine sensitivity protein SseB C-terminal domain-containing protein [Rhizomicrobium sp.]